MATRFYTPNVASRPKRREIPDEIWEEYKPAIINQLQRGSSIEKITGWIQSQKFPRFSPR
jgi:hypothetical protein